MLHYRTTRLTSVCAQAASTYTDTHTFTFFLACTQKHVHTWRCSSPFHGAAVYRLFQGSVSRRTQAIKQCITGSHCSYVLVTVQYQNNFISRYLKDCTLICMPVNHCVILTSYTRTLNVLRVHIHLLYSLKFIISLCIHAYSLVLDFININRFHCDPALLIV